MGEKERASSWKYKREGIKEVYEPRRRAKSGVKWRFATLTPSKLWLSNPRFPLMSPFVYLIMT